MDREVAALDELRRRMDRLFQSYDGSRSVGEDGEPSSYAWPRVNLYDLGDQIMLRAEVPGMGQEDIQISATQDVLTISGLRKSDAPEGYSVHRKERGSLEFSRSFTLPCRVDLEKTGATVSNGILTVTMGKCAEAQPRQITVKAKG